MSWWQALVLGIVEGVTEYLPVSSTGHLILVAWLLGLSGSDETWRATNTFNIVIQAGAILAVLGLYYGRVLQMVRGMAAAGGRAVRRRRVRPSVVLEGLERPDRDGARLAMNLVVAFLPAAALGPLLDDHIEHYLFKPWPVVTALFAGAWLMLAVAHRRRRSGREHGGPGLNHITWQVALLIGFGQCIAMWPGTSRSMMTIVTALMLGLRPRAAAEFSFLLGLVTLTAATGYKAVTGGAQMLDQVAWSNLLIGVITATVAAALAMKWFVAILIRHGVAPFGWYRLGVALLLAALLIAGVVKVPAAL